MKRQTGEGGLRTPVTPAIFRARHGGDERCCGAAKDHGRARTATQGGGFQIYGAGVFGRR